jgi:hypothetical protein
MSNADLSHNGDMKTNADLSHNGDMKTIDALCVITGIEECDFSRLLDRPRPLNMERQRSCDERSLNELSISLSPQPPSRTAEYSSRIIDHLEYSFSPGRRSGFNTPRSHIGFEPHPMVAEAWEALRRSLVHFRGQPVGTIAALDNSEEELNYDQVNNLYPFSPFYITQYKKWCELLLTQCS